MFHSFSKSICSLYSKFQVQPLKGGNLTPQNPSLGGGDSRCVAYISSLRFLAPKLEVQTSKGDNFTPKTSRYRGGEGVNFFQIYILCVSYIPSFRFLAPKLGVQPSKRGNFTPKTPRYGGGGKYFLNVYPLYSLNSKFQVPST